MEGGKIYDEMVQALACFLVRVLVAAMNRPLPASGSWLPVPDVFVRRFATRLRSRGYRGRYAEIRNDALVKEADKYVAYCVSTYGISFDRQHLLSALLRKGYVVPDAADTFKLQYDKVK